MTNPSDPVLAERVLPQAPHWNGHGKYGPALCMDNCTLHIMSRGFGAKDGDGYLTHDPTKCDWERDDEGGDYVVVPLDNSDLLFLRDQLNALFPVSTSPPADSGVVERQSTGASLRETGSREPSPSCTGLGPTGFDPARDDGDMLALSSWAFNVMLECGAIGDGGRNPDVAIGGEILDFRDLHRILDWAMKQAALAKSRTGMREGD